MTTHVYLFRLLGLLHIQLTEEKKGYNIYSNSKLSILPPYGAVFKQFNIIVLVGLASWLPSHLHMFLSDREQ